MQKKCSFFAAAVLVSFSALIIGCGGDNSSSAAPVIPEKCIWTIMYYGDADCNLESDLLEDVEEMKSGFVDGQGVALVALFDRSASYSSDSNTFVANFSDTRMYRITHGTAARITGGTKFPEITTNSAYEADMGDASTLKKFIEACKEQFPADHYALILSNHGGGCKSVTRASSSSVMSSAVSKSICWDESSGDDFLYTAEISDTLTSDDSVDLLGFDACLMSSVELAYQFRPGNGGFSASYIVACPPTETGYGWQYDNILSRLKSGGGNNRETDKTLGGYELNYDPSAMTSAQLGAVIVEEQRDSTTRDSSQALTCLDLSKASAVKTAVDALAVSLASKKSEMEALRGSGDSVPLLHYFDTSVTALNSSVYYNFATEWLDYPFFDLYNLAAAVEGSSSFDSTIKAKAAEVKNATDDMVLYSFANGDFSAFEEGKSGVHIFFADGDSTIRFKSDINKDGVTDADDTRTFWYYQDWYNANDISGKYADAPMGNLAWCRDGATAGNNTVENWFELLDSWYDTSNDSDGGVNYYQW